MDWRNFCKTPARTLPAAPLAPLVNGFRILEAASRRVVCRISAGRAAPIGLTQVWRAPQAESSCEFLSHVLDALTREIGATPPASGASSKVAASGPGGGGRVFKTDAELRRYNKRSRRTTKRNLISAWRRAEPLTSESSPSHICRHLSCARARRNGALPASPPALNKTAGADSCIHRGSGRILWLCRRGDCKVSPRSVSSR